MLGPILYDLQGAQSLDHRDRGIARYVTELALAIERLDPTVVSAYLLNPDLALPAGIEALVASGKLQFSDEAAVDDGALVHVTSPYELAVPIGRMLPAGAATARGIRVVATVFDLIPELLPEVYLADLGLCRRYRARHELVRQAHGILAISEFTKAEVTRVLGIESHKVRSIELAPSAIFRPAGPAHLVAGVDEPYVLYTGGSDGRKNVEGLLEGWSRLDGSIRRKWKLVIACHVPPLQKNHFEVRAAQLGFGDRLVVTGWVPEATLASLYRNAVLFVFPSLAEGYGLPIAEALACGSPTIGSNRTSVPELLPAEACFDPADPAAIAAAVTRGLNDGAYRARLLEWAQRPTRTWDDVAAETVAAYTSFWAAPQRNRAVTVPKTALAGRRPRRRLALVTPLPPQGTGVAAYSERLAAELSELADIEVFVDGPPHQREAILRADAPAGITARPLASLTRVEAVAGPFDSTIYCIGNSEYHTGALDLALRRPGIVLAHDVRLTNLYRFAQWQHPDATPGGFHATLQRMYAGGLPSNIGSSGGLDQDEAERWGVLMARDLIGASLRFLTTSDFAATLARLDALPADRDRVASAGFAIATSDSAQPPPVAAAAGERPGPPVVASFGVVSRVKQVDLVVTAFTRVAATYRDARLVFAGPAGDAERRAIEAVAAAGGIGDRVDVVGEISSDGYRDLLDRAWVAVQLRAVTNGESSAAIGDCLAAGVPTIVTAIGASRSLPRDAVVAVAPAIDPADLGDLLISLLDSPERRTALGAAAVTYATANTFRHAAERIYDEVSSTLD